MRYILYLQNGEIMGELDVSYPGEYVPAHVLVECAPEEVVAEIQTYGDLGEVEEEFTDMLRNFFFSLDRSHGEFINGFINFVQRVADAAHKKSLSSKKGEEVSG